MNQIIFLVSGKRSAGKDYFSKRMIKRCPHMYLTRVAKYMKEITKDLFGVNDEQLEKLKNDGSPIKLMPSFRGRFDTILLMYFGEKWGQLPEQDRISYMEKCLIDHNITTIRHFLQRFGTELAFPLFGKEVWIDMVLERDVSRVLKKGYSVIFPDIRFPHEIARINEKLGKAYKIVTIRINSNSVPKDPHISEVALDDYKFDYVIDNTAKNGEIDKYVAQIISKECEM